MKINKNSLFSFILGAIIFGSIGVAAAELFASNVRFTPSDSTWKKADGTKITNVAEAIDELYIKSNNNSNIIDLTSKTTANEYGSCYDLKKVSAFLDESNVFIRVKADKITEDCNVTYTVDLSDLELSTINFKNSFDLGNSYNYYFFNISTNTQSVSLKVDTNRGGVEKQNYDYVAYYSYTK